MGEGYLMQEAMGVCHDVIGDMDNMHLGHGKRKKMSGKQICISTWLHKYISLKKKGC